MNSKAALMAAIMGAAAVYLVYSYVDGLAEDSAKKFGSNKMVVVAAKTFPEMDSINETMLKTKIIPMQFLEPGAISFDAKTEEAVATKELKKLNGMIAVLPIQEGEQITAVKVSSPGIRTGLSSQVTPGKRAVSIPVDEFSSVSKLIKPGDRVDLIVVMEPGKNPEARISKVVLQDVMVLSVGRMITNNIPRFVEEDPMSKKKQVVRNLVNNDDYSSVTLEVDPIHVQTIALLTSGGATSWTFSLRNNDDADRVSSPSVMLTDVLGGDASRIPAKVQANPLDKAAVRPARGTR